MVHHHIPVLSSREQRREEGCLLPSRRWHRPLYQEDVAGMLSAPCNLGGYQLHTVSPWQPGWGVLLRQCPFQRRCHKKCRQPTASSCTAGLAEAPAGPPTDSSVGWSRPLLAQAPFPLTAGGSPNVPCISSSSCCRLPGGHKVTSLLKAASPARRREPSI